MKYFIVLFLVCCGARSFACLDYSGKYKTVDSNDQVVILTLVQTQCLQLDFSYDYGQGVVFEKRMILDGKQRIVDDLPSYKSTEAEYWDGNDIVMDGIVHNIQFKEEYIYKGKTFFDANGKLVEQIQYYDPNGNPSWEAKAVYTKLL